MEGLPLPTTLAQMLYAILFALLTGGSFGGMLAATATVIKAYQERGKPKADIHVSEATAGKIEGETRVSLMEALSAQTERAITRCNAAIVENDNLRTKLDEHSDLIRGLRTALRESDARTAECEAGRESDRIEFRARLAELEKRER